MEISAASRVLPNRLAVICRYPALGLFLGDPLAAGGDVGSDALIARDFFGGSKLCS